MKMAESLEKLYLKVQWCRNKRGISVDNCYNCDEETCDTFTDYIVAQAHEAIKYLTGTLNGFRHAYCGDKPCCETAQPHDCVDCKELRRVSVSNLVHLMDQEVKAAAWLHEQEQHVKVDGEGAVFAQNADLITQLFPDGKPGDGSHFKDAVPVRGFRELNKNERT